MYSLCTHCYVSASFQLLRKVGRVLLYASEAVLMLPMPSVDPRDGSMLEEAGISALLATQQTAA
jgi:hypothetical protein